MKVAIYARYSSENQRDASIADQFRVCREFAQRQGWHIAAEFSDHAVSGATIMRPGFQGMMRDALQKKFDIVMAEALDRFSRDQEDTAGLFKRLTFAGVNVVTLAEGDITHLHIGLKGTMNALFLKELAEKTRRGLRGRVEAGRSGGGISYGYRIVRRLENGAVTTGEREIVPEEAAVVRRIFKDYLAGASPKLPGRAFRGAAGRRDGRAHGRRGPGRAAHPLRGLRGQFIPAAVRPADWMSPRCPGASLSVDHPVHRAAQSLLLLHPRPRFRAPVHQVLLVLPVPGEALSQRPRVAQAPVDPARHSLRALEQWRIRSKADARRVQQLADALTADKIDAVFRNWLRRLPHPFSPGQRKAGYRYQLSILQAEFALTQVLDRPQTGRGFFEVPRRFLKTQGTRFASDEAKVTPDARYDATWVLRTNTTLAMEVVALAYKHLWMVEAMFRSMKSVLETRPMYHKRDETIRGHVFCSFLALVIREELERRLDDQGWTLEWADIVHDLDHLAETTITVDAKPYVIRSEIKGTLGKAFQAAGVAIPPAVRPG